MTEAQRRIANYTGGWLYLRGCDLKGVTIPPVGGWLDLGGCDLKGITLPTSIGGGLYAYAEVNLPELTMMHGHPGRLLTLSNYGLWLTNNGQYYAGCRGPFSKLEAIAHWTRTDSRAVAFTKAILNN
jgi:hypothetical protein